MKTYNYKPNPENDIKRGSALILYGLSHKEAEQPAWALPGGTFTTDAGEAERLAGKVYKLRNKK
jgi:hypothetical protein